MNELNMKYLLSIVVSYRVVMLQSHAKKLGFKSPPAFLLSKVLTDLPGNRNPLAFSYIEIHIYFYYNFKFHVFRGQVEVLLLL